MQKIALIVDSACDLSLETLNERNIKLLPLRISYSDKEYKDKIDISADEIYNNLEKEVPKTSLPSAEIMEEILMSLEDEGYTHVIAITISSGLSGTFNSIRLALEDHPKLTSYVFDTKILAMPEGIMALEVSDLINSGKSFEEIVSAIPKIRKSISGYFTINTLEYLKKGGRIGKISGTIGEMLNLKPVVSVDDDGVYYTVCKARGRKQSILKLTNILKDELSLGPCKVWVLQGGALEEAKKFMESIKDLKNIVSLNMSQISPALGVHGGPGLLGLAIQKVY
ncbi:MULTISPECIES: DegV family protein [Clostridium]|jgi:DegV family protein with EDD domain|uniref:DegV family protein n=1 Tax=Clostridium sartagoforme AAU1 TaxID=1202534 RepID=R9CAX9_9CLOT|nr:MULTISPECIES: DegV family protein [Clostridium]EOR26534.1 DegV family protein [Clostridium sartagoforme AAU1]KLE17480.1 DegV domain-containing protein [Clostridium sp. C8]